MLEEKKPVELLEEDSDEIIGGKLDQYKPRKPENAVHNCEFKHTYYGYCPNGGPFDSDSWSCGRCQNNIK